MAQGLTENEREHYERLKKQDAASREYERFKNHLSRFMIDHGVPEADVDKVVRAAIWLTVLWFNIREKGVKWLAAVSIAAAVAATGAIVTAQITEDRREHQTDQ